MWTKLFKKKQTNKSPSNGSSSSCKVTKPSRGTTKCFSFRNNNRKSTIIGGDQYMLSGDPFHFLRESEIYQRPGENYYRDYWVNCGWVRVGASDLEKSINSWCHLHFILRWLGGKEKQQLILSETLLMMRSCWKYHAKKILTQLMITNKLILELFQLFSNWLLLL